MIIALSLLIFTSCRDELNSEILDIQTKIVLNSFFCQGEPFRVYLSKSYSPFFAEKIEMIKDAEVVIYEDGSLLGELSYQIQTIDGYTDEYHPLIIHKIDSCFTNQDLMPKIGSEYKIEVKVEGMKTVWANSKIPVQVPIREFNTKKKKSNSTSPISPDSITYYEFVFDDADIHNYYLFSIECINIHFQYSQKYKLLVPFRTDDLAIGEFKYGLPFCSFPDISFNGKEYKLPIILEGEGEGIFTYNGVYTDSMEIKFRLNNVGTEFEKYLKSYLAFRETKDNPMAEPVPIYSNIENGLGIFAGYSSSIQPLTLYRKKKK